MSRIVLAGLGGPIPTTAIPDPNVDDNYPNVVLELNDGEPFIKTDWVGVGYTHYEVWVVGAAGGVGGRTADILWVGANEVGTPEAVTTFDVHIPDAVWDAVVALQWAETYSGPGTGLVWVEGRYVPYGQWNSQVWQPLSPPRWMSYNGEYQNYINPTHNGYTEVWGASELSDSVLYPAHPWLIGGGGGGGGVIVASGLLEDLDIATPVAIGRAGADGAPGQDVSGSPTYAPPPPNWDMRTNYMLGMFQDNHYFSAPADLAKVATINNWAYTWPLPHTIIPPPAPGEDGEGSSFGDIAVASGGKGGHPAIKWTGSPLAKSPDQVGGDGGVGGQSAAGGGGLGSLVQGGAGKDGTWDGSIGGGGGGGFGGSYTPSSGVMGGSPVVKSASNGGQGAYSYADTTVFGARQYRQNWVEGSVSAPIIPGGGGGVRANHTEKAGSKATGYSPDGVVLIRIFKVD